MQRGSLNRRRIVLCAAAAAALPIAWTAAGLAPAMEYVSFQRDGRHQQVDGRVLVEAQDGGLLVLARDGVLWAVQPEELVEHRQDEKPFAALSEKEFAERLGAELPAGFRVHSTAHYLIFYNTSTAYAQWCGSLFERLYMAFTNYFRRQRFEIREPEFPLVAVVFADRAAYVEHSKPVLGDAAGSIIGYFNLRTNRMTMYDLTGVEAASRITGGTDSVLKINRWILAQPEAMRQVSTIVHEATHQIAFNCGMHQRYSDTPVWLSEGIAMYFETPDLKRSTGWAGVGEVNRARLAQFRDYLRRRPADSLETLIADDARFRDTKKGLDAYAEAWALTYYLVHRRPDQFVAYLKTMSGKLPLLDDDPKTRIEEFRAAFGDLKRLDADMVRYMMVVGS